MKIKDIIGEEAKMVVKDFKPGVSLSMVDPTTDTMTTVDLKKNPTALQTTPDGKFMYDPTPDAAAPGEPKQPELKPGAQIDVDMTTSEELDDVDDEADRIRPDTSYDKHEVVIDELIQDLENEEGYAPGTALDVKNERMDESAIITALARKVSGTDVKTKTKSKEVFDIKKLAGL